MMIKSTAVGSDRKKNEFPKLMVSKNNGTVVVLFTKEGEGTCISSDYVHNEVGEFSRAWHMPFFEPWSGKVVIEQD